MIMLAYSVYDKAVSAYMPMFFCRSSGEAIRSFTEYANDGKSPAFKYPGDYTLYFLGSWDDNSGVFAGTDPQRVVSAQEVAEPVAPAPDPGIERAQSLRNGRVPM